MGSNYGRQAVKQLEDVLERLDVLTELIASKDAEIERLNGVLASMTSLEKAYEAQIAEIEQLKLEKSQFIAQNAQLTETVTKLTDEIARLRSRLDTDSHNSSNPPSSDSKPKKQKAANEHNGRKKSGKGKGGQNGHKGRTLTEEDARKMIESKEYVHEVKNIGDVCADYKVRYVIDFQIVPTITEYRIYADENGRYPIPEELRSVVTYGANTRALAVSLYSEGVVSNKRICSLINDLSDGRLPVSEGSIYGFLKGFADKTSGFISEIKQRLLDSPVIYTDGTVVTVNGVQNYVRNESTDNEVLYCAMEKKTIDAMKEAGILEAYVGTLVHDHETTLYRFGQQHAECNVHLLRYLTKNSEDTGNKWSEAMICFLLKAKKAREEGELTEESIAKYEKEYDAILEDGKLQNEATRPQWAKKDEKRLLNRLIKYKKNHLLFLRDASVPFDNNLSERDLRKCKNRQKMAGGFRDFHGLEMYCSIMSFVETIKKRKQNIFGSIRAVYSDSFA